MRSFRFVSLNVVIAFALLVGFFSAPAALKAQQNTASITGTVTDPTGAAIPGANVTLENPQTGVTYKTVSNAEGSYTINLVQPGPGYKIEFARDGFSPLTVSGLYMNVDNTRVQNARLNVGAAQVTVQVSASNQDQTIDTTDAQIGNNVQVSSMNDLPILERDSPAALFVLQPGVTSGGASAVVGAVTGARVDQSNVTLDGLDVNDNETGNFGAIVANAPVDSVQEFRGVVAGQLSSAGEGGAGQFQLVTRSGTNHFHGSLSEYHRDEDLEANDWFNNNSEVARPPLIRNQFGGSVGGPIWKDRLFFFFAYEGRRDTLSNLVDQMVPIDSYRDGSVNYDNAAGGMSTLTPAGVAALDPLGIGYSASLLALYSSRYPHANDFSGTKGDLINTAGFRFNAPFPYKENNYIQSVDFTLNPKMKFRGVGHFTKTNGTQSAIQFPGDPETHPFLDQSYTWAGINTWTLSDNKVNQLELGETYENYSFPCSYNPEGDTQFGDIGGNGSGGDIVTGPYSDCGNAQGRTYPILMIKDDFSWNKGNHSFTFGGQTKRISPDNFVILDYNGVSLGLGGNTSQLNSSLRPPDLASGNATALYDSAFALALAPYTDTSATFNYNSAQQPLPQGTGLNQDFRFYETEIYFGDTWKVTPNLTISYGVRWLNYSVPYERHGLEALSQFGSQSLSNSTFNYLFGARLAQSAAGISGNDAVPLISYVLGGKKNHAQSYYAPEYHDYAPRVAFAYSPSWDKRTVFDGGSGIVYDHTVISSIQYQQTQYNYIFKSSINQPFGTVGDPSGSLMIDTRFSGLTSPVAPPPAPSVTTPNYPFVSNPGTPNAVPDGLINGGAFNEIIDPHFHTPYSIGTTFGMQHEFPHGFLLKTSYAGRLGRRLMAQADEEQLIDFPDKASGQLMSQAFASITQQLRAGVNPANVTAQPWYEDVLPPGSGVAAAAYYGIPGVTNNTTFVTQALGTYVQRGDFADTTQQLAATGLLPPNVGMAAQLSENTIYTNKGFSGYNGLLVTLHKNMGFGLTFDINYTWSHSIDNVSVTANTVAYGGYGFICDVVRPRECRGNSDFDIADFINGTFVYDLPYGHGRPFGSSSPWLVNELLGGWSVSGIPIYHTGTAYFAGANAFVAGYANNAPGILVGNKGDLKIQRNGGNGNPLYAFSNPAQANADYTGPVGFQIGSRNNLRGPQYADLDMGLNKTFPVWRDVVVKLRGDAFNVLNHPNFNNPTVDITDSAGPFGTITSDQGIGNPGGPRVLQVALRVEF